MTIFLQKVSDYKNFQYQFLSERNLNTLKARRIAHYKAMIKALEEDTRDFERYLRYEHKLRKMIISKRYSYERLEHLMDKVHEMRWYIEEEFGQSDDQCISVLPSPEGYAEKRWRNARRSALARQEEAQRCRVCTIAANNEKMSIEEWRTQRDARRREMQIAIDRGEASLDDFYHVCGHRWDENDREHDVWVCPQCEKILRDNGEIW